MDQIVPTKSDQEPWNGLLHLPAAESTRNRDAARSCGVEIDGKLILSGLLRCGTKRRLHRLTRVHASTNFTENASVN